MRSGVRLGIDVGAARVGVAASDPDGVLATPVMTLTREPAQGGDVRAVAAEVLERAAIEVIVGLPLSLSGGEGDAAIAARAWAGALKRELPRTSIRLLDERLSTVDAHRAMRDSGLDTRRHRAHVDQQAAVLILQVALDSERRTGKPAGESVGGRKPRSRPSRPQEGQG